MTVSEINFLLTMFSRYSSWYRLKRGVAWLQRFVLYLNNKKKITRTDLTLDDLKRAEESIFRFDQKVCFGKEYNDILYYNRVPKSSHLYKLEPYADSEDLLRVGVRLTHAPISDEAKNQLLMSSRSHIALLIVRDAHEKAKHSGTEYVLAILREKYWIVGARSLIKSFINRCVVCKVLYSMPKAQRMADLLQDRLAAGSPPFTNVGIDVFGPFYVKKGRTQEKRYGLIFTCLVLRAIHIEVLSSLDSDAFINAIIRFSSKRAKPVMIRCDNGTNFIGGSRELPASIDDWNKRVCKILIQQNIKFVFNPPGASHMGGAWERLIRSIRRVMNAVIRNTVLDDERLATVFCEVEASSTTDPLQQCRRIPTTRNH